MDEIWEDSAHASATTMVVLLAVVGMLSAVYLSCAPGSALRRASSNFFCLLSSSSTSSTSSFSKSGPGCPGPVLVEHVNLSVRNTSETLRWHVERHTGVKHPRKKGRTLHLNVGSLTQLHLPEEDPADPWRGRIHLACHSHEGAPRLEKDPDGNAFVIERAKSQVTALLTLGYLPCPSNSVGMSALTVWCPTGAAASIAAFYERIFGFQVSVRLRKDPCAPEKEYMSATFGTSAGQTIMFCESADEYATAVSGADRNHICLYLPDEAYEPTFHRSRAEGIAWVNPDFPSLDGAVLSLQSARDFGQFRIEYIVDAEGNRIMRLEHEVRAAGHGRFPAANANRFAEQAVDGAAPVPWWVRASSQSGHAVTSSLPAARGCQQEQHTGTPTAGTWIPVAHILSDFGEVRAGNFSCLVDSNVCPSWHQQAVALYRFDGNRGSAYDRVFAMQNACPHVAIGELVGGDAMPTADIEDLGLDCPPTAVVACPVHSFTFDVSTGQCVSDGGCTKRGNTYKTRVGPTGIVYMFSEPDDGAEKENTFSKQQGHKAQMAIVERALGF